MLLFVTFRGKRWMVFRFHVGFLIVLAILHFSVRFHIGLGGC